MLIGIGGDAGEHGVDLPGARRTVPPGAACSASARRCTSARKAPSPTSASGVDVLGVERIDHGVSLLDDPALVAEVAERRIAVTACPTSNVSIGVVDAIEHHPWPRFREAGVLVTLNSDNAEMFGVDLADELVPRPATRSVSGFDDSRRSCASTASVRPGWTTWNGPSMLATFAAAAIDRGPEARA